MFQVVFIVGLVWRFVAVGQVANSVTVKGSRNPNPQPDQIVLAVAVDSGLDVSRDQVLAALQGSGITLANFQRVFTVQQYSTSSRTYLSLLEWTFSLPTALSDLKSTAVMLSTGQANIAKNSP